MHSGHWPGMTMRQALYKVINGAQVGYTAWNESGRFKGIHHASLNPSEYAVLV